MNESDGLTPAAGKMGRVYAPVITPFREDGGGIDFYAFSALLGHLSASHVDGILLLGTNGEFGYLSLEEKWALIDAVARADTGLGLMVGATVPDSREETLLLAQSLDERLPLPATLLIAPPFYDRYARGGSATPAEVLSFYRELLDLQLRIPIFAYNLPVPGAGPVSAAASPELIALLAGTGDLGNFAGVKDSTGNVDNISAYLAAVPEAAILVGHDHAVSGGIMRGAAGSITACANLFPSAVQAVWSAASAAERQQAQVELSQLRTVIESIPGKMIGAEKLLLWKLGVLSDRTPLRNAAARLSAAEERQLLAALAGVLESLEVNAGLRRVLADAT